MTTETPGVGHNSGASPVALKPASVAVDQLRSIVERVERLEEEKQAIADDIKEVFAEAKANGYDTPTLRMIVKLRRQDSAERQEREALLDLYMTAMGMRSADSL